MNQNQSRAERAVELFMEGYNCAQAVFGAFADLLGMDMDAAMKLASGLGGGVCRMRETCGAVTGGILALGALRGNNDPQDDMAKQMTYARGQKLGLAFKEKFGTVCCAKLLDLPHDRTTSPIPTPRTAEFYQSRPCAKFVYEMARLVEEDLKEDENA